MKTILLSDHAKAWQLMALLEGSTIGEVLKIRRLDLARTDRAMSVIAMGKILKDSYGKSGRTGTWINNLELGNGSDIMVLLPEVRLHLLQLYAFTPQEIAELNERFSLRLPKDPEVKNPTFRRYSDMDKLTETSVKVLGISGTESFFVSEFVLQGHNAGSVFTLDTAGKTLACDEVRRRYKGHFRLFFDGAETPNDADIVAYRIKGRDDYVLQVFHSTPPEKPVAVHSYDGNEILVLYPGDPELEFLGVRFTAWEQE